MNIRRRRGRPKGSRAARRKVKSTIQLFPEHWSALDDIGPSRGRAVEKLIDVYNKNTCK